MLERSSGKVRQHGFLVSVEIAENCRYTPEKIALILADSLAWTEGIGYVDVNYMGVVDEVPEASKVQGTS